jgi:HlyD family secretion protein
MKRFLAVLLVAVVIGGSWYLYTRTQAAKPQVQTGITTAPVGRANVESTINAIGSLAPERQQALAFATTGQVIEVLVQESDIVTEGQLLARLDARDAELNLEQARAALAVSEASLARSRKPASAEDIASAEAALASAQTSLEELGKGPSSRDKQLASLNIDQAKNSLYGAQASRDSIKGSPMSTPGQVASAEAQVLNAELAVKIAQINYAKLFEPVRDAQIKAAEAQIAQAEATLARLKAQPAPEDLVVTEAQVAQARVSVRVAERRLDDLVFTAPFSGTLASWSLHLGDRATPGNPVGTLLDATRYHISLSIDETEISRIKLGSVARITLDAYPTQELTGHVTEIGLLGTSVQGLINYAVRIDLEPTDLELKPMMTASIEIVIETRDNVLVVPNRALKRDAGGKYVEILQAGVVTKLYITTGVSSDENTEVLAGLEEGQEIIITKPRENAISGGLFGG